MTDQRSSRTLRIAALALVVFVAGVAVGVIADRLSTPRPLVRTQLRLGVFDELQLSPTQRAQLDSIAMRRAPRSKALMNEMAGHLQAVADSVDNELRAILTPQQQDRLDSLLKRAPGFRLRRKVITPAGTTIFDTVFPARRDSARRP